MAGEEVDAGRQALLDELVGATVEFVLIGGAAIQTYGVSYITRDIDVTPARTDANLARLAGALNELGCRLAVDPERPDLDVPVPAGYFTAGNLNRQGVWNLATRHGKLDITFEPSGFPAGYEQLRPRAQRRRVAATSVTVLVAALEDVEHSKRTANRPKDRAYLSDVGRL